MVLTVTLNGPDDVGKAEQIAMLKELAMASDFIPTPGLSMWAKAEVKIRDIPNLPESKELWASSNETFVTELFTGLLNHYREIMVANGKAKAVIFSHGHGMFKALAVARIAQREANYDLDAARRKFYSILTAAGHNYSKEPVSILLKRSNDQVESRITTSNNGDAPVDESYAMFEKLFLIELQNQEKAGWYDYIIETGPPTTRFDIQDRILGILRSHFMDPLLAPAIKDLRIFFLCGLSQSGVTTVAKKVQKEYFPRAYCLNISQLVNEGNKNFTIRTKFSPEHVRAEILLQGIGVFVRMIPIMKLMIIDGITCPYMIHFLRLWLREIVQIVFIDSSAAQRHKRSTIPRDQLDQRDDSCKGKDIKAIRKSSHLQLKNNGPVEDTIRKLASFVSSQIELHERRGQEQLGTGQPGQPGQLEQQGQPQVDQRLQHQPQGQAHQQAQQVVQYPPGVQVYGQFQNYRLSQTAPHTALQQFQGLPGPQPWVQQTTRLHPGPQYLQYDFQSHSGLQNSPSSQSFQNGFQVHPSPQYSQYGFQVHSGLHNSQDRLQIHSGPQYIHPGPRNSQSSQSPQSSQDGFQVHSGPQYSQHGFQVHSGLQKFQDRLQIHSGPQYIHPGPWNSQSSQSPQSSQDGFQIPPNPLYLQQQQAINIDPAIPQWVDETEVPESFHPDFIALLNDYDGMSDQEIFDRSWRIVLKEFAEGWLNVSNNLHQGPAQ